MKTAFLKNFQIFAGQACNFIKKRLQYRYFPMNIAKCFEKHVRTDASVMRPFLFGSEK